MSYQLDKIEYDAIILGTGLLESIIAGALARAGKTVLHLDRNDYYGSHWTAFGFNELWNWGRESEELSKKQESEVTQVSNGIHNDLNENSTRKFIPFFQNQKKAYSFIESYIQPPPSSVPSSPIVLSLDRTEPNTTIDTLRDAILAELKSHLNSSGTQLTPDVISELNTTSSNLAKSLAPTSCATVDLTTPLACLRVLAQLFSDTRKYSFDLAPKLLSSRGALVELLIQSGVSRYLEFKGVEASYVHTSEGFDRVPTSKDAIFKSKTLPYPVKRKLMRFLEFTASLGASSEETGNRELISGYESRPFIDFLREKFNISGAPLDAILYGVALADDNSLLTLEGITRTTNYLQSMGRFGPFAHLIPLYGGGSEIAQAFCRVCAVFGGVYVLGFPVKDAILEKNDHGDDVVRGIGSNEEVVKGKWVICGEDYLCDEWTSNEESELLARAVAILDGPIHVEELTSTDENEPEVDNSSNYISQTVFPPNSCAQNHNTITAICLNHGSGACPRGQYVLHLTTIIPRASSKTPKEVLLPALETLATLSSLASGTANVSPNQPHAIFVHFHAERIRGSRHHVSNSVPSNVLVIGGPDKNAEYDKRMVEEAKNVFWRVIGEEREGIEFLPAETEETDEIIEDEN